MAAPVPEAPLELNDEQRRTGATLGQQIGIVSMLLMVLAVLRVASGVVRFGNEKLLGVADILEGLITAAMGLVLLNARDAAGYLAEVKGYEKTHFLNMTSNLSVWVKVQIALGAIVGIVALLRLVM